MTEVGEPDCPAAIVTLRDWPIPVVVTSWATAALVLLTVTVTLGAPTRSGWVLPERARRIQDPDV